MNEQFYSNFKTLLGALILTTLMGCSKDQALVTAKDDHSEVTFDRRSSNFNFTAALKGQNEIPPKETTAAGNAVVKISKDESFIYYKLIVANIENVLASHFHMAPPDENGPVVAFLFSGPATGRTDGVLAEGTITAGDVIGPLAGDLDALIDRIRRGRIYVNVHTTAIPSGELRGNL